MPDIPVIKDAIGAAGAFVGFLITLGGVARWLVRTELPRRREKRETEQAKDEVLLGRPAVPANPITGEPAQPAKPAIGQLVAEIWHELHPNGGSSMKDSQARMERAVTGVLTELHEIKDRLARGDVRFDRLEHAVGVELHTANDAVANAAEAAAHLLPVLGDAINAQPPAQPPEE